MTQMQGVKETASEPAFESWTSEGYYKRSRAGAAQFDTLLEKAKGMRVPSVEGTERHAVHCINLARQDVVFKKSARTWMVFGVIIAGFTLGATWVAAPVSEEPVKEGLRQ